MCALEITVGESQNKTQDKEARAQRSRSSVREKLREPEVQNMVAVAMVGLFLGFWVIHRYGLSLPGILAQRDSRNRTSAWLREAIKRDPKIGQAVTVPPLFTLDGRKVSLPERQGLTALTFIGNCTACATRDTMLSTQSLERRFPKVKFYLVVMSGDREVARALWSSTKLSVPLVIDRDGDAAMSLNAIYKGRRYLIDSRGRLLYLSGREQTPEQIERDMSQAALGDKL